MRIDSRKTTKDAISRLLDEAIGQRIISINRIFYEYQGKIDQSSGELEIVFERFAILFGCFSDGQTLAVSEGGWIDYFQEPLSPENQKYVQTHGQWVRSDMAARQPYSPLVGNELKSYRLLQNEFGTLAGVELVSKDSAIVFVTSFDEEQVVEFVPNGFSEIAH